LILTESLWSLQSSLNFFLFNIGANYGKPMKLICLSKNKDEHKFFLVDLQLVANERIRFDLRLRESESVISATNFFSAS
jgi:hypothetical protein